MISWEYPDGSGGAFEAEDESALDWAMAVAEEHPGARVWCGDDIIASGFVVSDERAA